MRFGITECRLRTEWHRAFLFLFCILLWAYIGLVQIHVIRDYATYESLVEGSGSHAVSSAYGIQQAIDMDSEEAFKLYQAEHRDEVYYQGMSYTLLTAFLIGNALAVMLICVPFQKRQVSRWIYAGYSRARVFLALTLTYYLVMILIWFCATWLMRFWYSVSFSHEERKYFLVTQMSWMFMTLARVSLCYFFAFLFRRPLPAFLVSLFIEFPLGPMHLPERWFIPVKVQGNLSLWQPGSDLSTLLRGDAVALFLIIAAIVGAWFCFRKRGLE